MVSFQPLWSMSLNFLSLFFRCLIPSLRAGEREHEFKHHRLVDTFLDGHISSRLKMTSVGSCFFTKASFTVVLSICGSVNCQCLVSISLESIGLKKGCLRRSSAWTVLSTE